jgi:DNA-binding transcriptional MerR regulator
VGPEKTYSISEAAAAIGVSVPTLRSWERRYAFVTPERTPGGHRRYSEEDVDRLRTFVEVSRRRRAGSSARLLEELDKGRGTQRRS